MKEDDALTPTANSTGSRKAVDRRALVPSSSRKGSELTIEALYAIGTQRPREGCRSERGEDEIPDEGERARLISDITRLIREPHMPETTRCAGLTLIGWLARRMPGEAPHALGVSVGRAGLGREARGPPWCARGPAGRRGAPAPPSPSRVERGALARAAARRAG